MCCWILGDFPTLFRLHTCTFADILERAHAPLHTHWPLCSLIKKLEHPVHIYHLVVSEPKPSTSSLPGGEVQHSNQPPASLTSIIPEQHLVEVIQHTQSHTLPQHALMRLTPLCPNHFCFWFRRGQSQLETTLTQNGWHLSLMEAEKKKKDGMLYTHPPRHKSMMTLPSAVCCNWMFFIKAFKSFESDVLYWCIWTLQ